MRMYKKWVEIAFGETRGGLTHGSFEETDRGKIALAEFVVESCCISAFSTLHLSFSCYL
jgi:hypothetical protein